MSKIKVDVAIIGCGCGGAMAALELGKKGLNVAIFEKDEGYGQALKGVNGYFAVGTREQKEKHYMEKPEKYFKLLMDHALWGVEPKIVSDFVNRSAEISHWLCDNGAEIENMIAYFPGCDHTWMYMPQNHRIYHAIVPALAQLPNVKLYDKTSVTKILREGDAVNGLEVLDERTGERYCVDTKSVVIATGEDQALMRGTVLSPYKGADMAEAVGAARLRSTVASTGGGPPADGDFRQPCNLFVNLDGNRFTDESITVRIDDIAFCASTQKKGEYYVILDDNVNQWYLKNGWVDFKYGMGAQVPSDLMDFTKPLDDAPAPGGPGGAPGGPPGGGPGGAPDGPGGFDEAAMMAEMQRNLRKQVIIADSVEELAEKTGLPLENLRKTIDAYNEACLSGRDTTFYKDPEYLVPLIKPPFFANKRSAELKELAGVIKTNGNMEVLDQNFDVIPGLYAIGGVASPINGQMYTHRCAGSRATFALIGGRIVSEHLPDYLYSTYSDCGTAPERVDLELDKIDTGFPVEYETVTMPDGAVFKHSVWNAERVADMCRYLKGNVDVEGKNVVYRGILSCWIMQAVENALPPHRALHVTGYLQNKEIAMEPLPIGEPDPRAGLQFDVVEDGDDLFITVTCDDQRIHYHNYDVSLLRYAKVPSIPEGKNVYLRVKGATCCILTFAKTYQPFCKSLYMWAHHDNNPKRVPGELYGCAYSTSPEHIVGTLKEMPR